MIRLISSMAELNAFMGTRAMDISENKRTKEFGVYVSNSDTHVANVTKQVWYQLNKEAEEA